MMVGMSNRRHADNGINAARKAVKAERVRRGWSIRDAANHSNGHVSNQTWGNFEDGHTASVTLKMSAGVRAAFGWPAGWEHDPPKPEAPAVLDTDRLTALEQAIGGLYGFAETKSSEVKGTIRDAIGDRLLAFHHEVMENFAEIKTELAAHRESVEADENTTAVLTAAVQGQVESVARLLDRLADR